MKIPKREIKYQRELYNSVLNYTGSRNNYEHDQFADNIFENLNPSIMDNISEGGVYFTPYGLAQDLAVFTPRYGHIVDVCCGIGMLSYRIKQMDSYDKNIESLTCIELNPHFVEIGKKLLPEANWICGNVYDQNMWQDLTKDLPDQRFDCMVSNPPFGNDMNKKDYSWLNYTGHRDLMALELCLRYAKRGMFILPSGSVTFKYSGRQWGYEDDPDRYSQKLKKFIRENNEFKWQMYCDGIDTSVHKDDWKNLPGGIGCEVVDIQLFPWSLDREEDAL